LTDENNKQYSGEKQAAPKLVLSDLPPLNMISEDEGEGEPVLESAPASAPASASASVPAETSTSEQTPPTTTEVPSPDVQPVPASAVDVLYRHESCTCQTPRNVIIGMIDLFVLASAIYIYVFTTQLNRQCPA